MGTSPYGNLPLVLIGIAVLCLYAAYYFLRFPQPPTIGDTGMLVMRGMALFSGALGVALIYLGLSIASDSTEWPG